MSNEPLEDRVISLFKEVWELSHATYVLVAAAALDGALKIQLLKKMPGISRTLERRIYDGYGPLSNFSARTDLAVALGIISQDTYQKIRRFNQVRVEFAHTPDILTLADDSVKEPLRLLIGVLEPGQDPLPFLMDALEQVAREIEAG